MSAKHPVRLTFEERSPSPVLGTEPVTAKCGHGIVFDLYVNDPFRAQRRAKAERRDCQACRQARVQAEAGAHKDRRANKWAFKSRLPDGSRFVATYDATAVRWVGTLTVEGVTFDRQASSLHKPLYKLDDAYRAQKVNVSTMRVCFRGRHLDLLARVEACVARVFDTWGNELRCHELVRAIDVVVGGREHGMVVVDGKCGPIEHSWLYLPDSVILDPYTPGRLPAVQLVDLVVGAAYRPGMPRTDIRQAVVDRLVIEMRGAAPAAARKK